MRCLAVRHGQLYDLVYQPPACPRVVTNVGGGYGWWDQQCLCKHSFFCIIFLSLSILQSIEEFLVCLLTCDDTIGFVYSQWSDRQKNATAEILSKALDSFAVSVGLGQFVPWKRVILLFSIFTWTNYAWRVTLGMPSYCFCDGCHQNCFNINNYCWRVCLNRDSVCCRGQIIVTSATCCQRRRTGVTSVIPSGFVSRFTVRQATNRSDRVCTLAAKSLDHPRAVNVLKSVYCNRVV